MGLFDAFKKKECSVCGGEIGLLGNRKLEDGNLCKNCARKLSPWFDDRRHSTVEQIKAQLSYREQNAINLQSFTVSRIVGESYKLYVEEVGGVPTRFFVTDATDYMAANPDIIAFTDIVSCVTDIQVRDEEMKQRNSEGNMISYNPPRFKHHHDFYIKMQIRNNPYFDDLRFHVNRGVVTLESVGGFGANMASSFMRGAGVRNARISTGSIRDIGEQKRFNEYQEMCEIIEQIVEDGKRGASGAAQDPVQMLFVKISNASMNELDALLKEGCALTWNRPDYKEIQNKICEAINARTNQLLMMREGNQTNAAAVAPQAPACPKFCPACGAPTEGSKFCQHCGNKLF